MREYSASDFTELAFKLLEHFAEVNVRHIVCTYIVRSPIPSQIGKLAFIQICKNEIYTSRDNNRWQERIQITPIEHNIRFLADDEGRVKIKEMIEALKKLNRYQISICVKILKKLSYSEAIVGLFDRIFLVKAFLISEKEGRHLWFYVRNDLYPESVDARFYEMSKEEALAFII